MKNLQYLSLLWFVQRLAWLIVTIQTSSLTRLDSRLICFKTQRMVRYWLLRHQYLTIQNNFLPTGEGHLAIKMF
jgi:hypothetical protein